MGPRAGVDAVVKRKIPSPRRKSNPRSPIAQPAAQRYTDWAITALYCYFKQVVLFVIFLCNELSVGLRISSPQTASALFLIFFT
jgi:hypothetical protein